MAKISKIKLPNGVSYDINDASKAEIVSLTKAQYNALTTKNPNVYYAITDDYNTTPVQDAINTQNAKINNIEDRMLDLENTVPKTIDVVEVGEGKTYTSFTEAMFAIENITSKEIIVKVYGGTYDLYNELGKHNGYTNGDNWIKSLGSTRKGWLKIGQPVLKNPNISIIGIGEVNLTLNISSSVAISSYPNYVDVSAINTIAGLKVENITFNLSNCRYAIHDECGGEQTHIGEHHIYKNLRIYGTGILHGLGIGASSGVFELNDCYINVSGKTGNACFYLHDWDSSKGVSLTIKDCVLESSGTNAVIFNTLGTQVVTTNFYNTFAKAVNCSLDTTHLSSGPNNFRIIGKGNSFTSSNVTFTGYSSNPYTPILK